MKDAFIAAAMQSAGEPSPAVVKKILNGFAEEMTALAAAGGDSKAATASKRVGAEASKAAAAADPTEAADNAAFEKAGGQLAAACKAAGVDLDL